MRNAKWNPNLFLSFPSEFKPAPAILGFFALLFLVLAAGPAGAYFEDLGMGVRPVGMGEAFTAVADDSNALVYNVAGIADLKAYEVNLMYADLYSNLNARLYTGQNDSLGYHNVGFVYPGGTELGSFGATWLQFSSQLYRENTFVAGYAREIGHDVFDWFNASQRVRDIKLNGGINLKVLNWIATGTEYSAVNPALGGGDISRTGVTADLGLLATWVENVRFGASLENFIPANLGITVYETAPINFRFGVSYLHDWKGQLGYLDSLLTAVDFTQRYGYSDIRAGLEGSFFKKFILLRAGTTVDQFSAGLSVNAALNASPMDLRLDYAFSYPYAISDTWGSHRISLVVSWGNPQKEPVVVLAPEESLSKKRDEELAAGRAGDEAKLRAMMLALRSEIEIVRSGLEDIQRAIKSGTLKPIRFADGKGDLEKSSLLTLDAVGALLVNHPDVKVRIDGHVAATADPKSDAALSQDRAGVVREYLATLFKLHPNNLLASGFGGKRPIADNSTPEGKTANQRMEFKVLLPAGIQDESAHLAAAPRQKIKEAEFIHNEDVAAYDDVDKMRQKLKVYELQMNPAEVEELFQQQHRETGEK